MKKNLPLLENTPTDPIRDGDRKSRPCFVRMFKPQFAPLVESGGKLQTVRPTPKRMPQAGDRISLRAWEGKPYRSKQRVLREATISGVKHCRISTNGVIFLDGTRAEKGFARRDGFPSLSAFVDWFRNQHGLPFEGIAIFWTKQSLRSSVDRMVRICLAVREGTPLLEYYERVLAAPLSSDDRSHDDDVMNGLEKP